MVAPAARPEKPDCVCGLDVMAQKQRTSEGFRQAVLTYMEQKLLFPFSPTEFSFSPFSVGLPLAAHPSGTCAGGIKVALLSSKLQISFASVHLPLCFTTVARGSTRFRSALRGGIIPTGCYSPLSLTPLLLRSAGRRILFMELPLLGHTVKSGSTGSSRRM